MLNEITQLFIIFIIITIYELNSPFITKEERLNTFHPDGVITDFFQTSNSKPVDKKRK